MSKTKQTVSVSYDPKWYSFLREGVKITIDKVPVEHKISFQILSKTAKECTELEFKNLILEGKIPSLKLSKKEMDLIKAGGWADDLRAFWGRMNDKYGWADDHV